MPWQLAKKLDNFSIQPKCIFPVCRAFGIAGKEVSVGRQAAVDFAAVLRAEPSRKNGRRFRIAAMQMPEVYPKRQRQLLARAAAWESFGRWGVPYLVECQMHPYPRRTIWKVKNDRRTPVVIVWFIERKYRRGSGKPRPEVLKSRLWHRPAFALWLTFCRHRIDVAWRRIAFRRKTSYNPHGPLPWRPLYGRAATNQERWLLREKGLPKKLIACVPPAHLPYESLSKRKARNLDFLRSRARLAGKYWEEMDE